MLDSKDYQEIAEGIALCSYFDGEDMVIQSSDIIRLLAAIFKEDNPCFSEKMFREACKK